MNEPPLKQLEANGSHGMPRRQTWHNSLPVVDDDGRLVGIVAQSDMIATLYEKNLGKPAGSTGMRFCRMPWRCAPG